jgi:O-antigen ligase
MITIIATFGIAAAIFRRPAVGAMLILALAHLEGALMFGGHSAVKLATVLCVGVLAFRMLVTRGGIRIDDTTLFILVFLIWISITLLWNQNQADSLSRWLSFVLQCFLYFLLLNLIQSKQDVKLALWGHVLGGSVLAIIAVQTMTSQNFIRTDIAGLGINLAARMVGLNLLLSILLYQLATSRLAKSVLLMAAILSGVGAVVPLSRGNWYALAISITVLATISVIKGKRQFTAKQVLLWICIGCVVFFFLDTLIFTEHGIAKLSKRFQSAYTFSDSAAGRFDIWQAGWKLFLEAPLWGHGFDSFAEENPYFNKPAHNAYVRISVENGLIGLSFFILILGSVFRKLWKLFWQRGANSFAVAWGMALFTFLAIASMVDSAVDRKYLWYVFGLITLLIRHYGEGEAIKIDQRQEIVEKTELLPV